ncbi:hypothetical protein MRB53_021233 [Persea americana]|uniref:Uncharacterized protein n=1 Tax=Persea americana TaxID=3435 RepID=A0ACC2L305_PERAE|nr:hypothetical protein MRB53_021233 [Persea americana]
MDCELIEGNLEGMSERVWETVGIRFSLHMKSGPRLSSLVQVETAACRQPSLDYFAVQIWVSSSVDWIAARSSAPLAFSSATPAGHNWQTSILSDLQIFSGKPENDLPLCFETGSGFSGFVWRNSITYLRLDGYVEPERRFEIVKAFNSDPTIDVLLLTTHDGGLGLNLTSADTGFLGA